MSEFDGSPAQRSMAISDEYRRAVRNSLIWSGLTFLVAIGKRPSETAEVDVTFLGTGLLYPQWGATIVGFSIAIYMLAAFDRVDRRLLRDHREFFFARTAADVSDAIDALKLEIENTTRTFALARAEF